MVSMEEPEKNLLQLGKGGMDDFSGGAPPPRTSPLFFFPVYFAKQVALFSSPPQKLSLPPSDRARRCDSESPIERSGAQISAKFRAD